MSWLVLATFRSRSTWTCQWAVFRWGCSLSSCGRTALRWCLSWSSWATAASAAACRSGTAVSGRRTWCTYSTLAGPGLVDWQPSGHLAASSHPRQRSAELCKQRKVRTAGVFRTRPRGAHRDKHITPPQAHYASSKAKFMEFAKHSQITKKNILLMWPSLSVMRARVSDSN